MLKGVRLCGEGFGTFSIQQIICMWWVAMRTRCLLKCFSSNSEYYCDILKPNSHELKHFERFLAHRKPRCEIKQKSMRFNHSSEMKCWCGCWSVASAVSAGDDRSGPRWSDYGSAAEWVTWPERRAARRLCEASTLIWKISPDVTFRCRL